MPKKQDLPVEGSGAFPILTLGGRPLYALPWTGLSLTDTGNTFSAREWATRKLARKRAKASRQKNRRLARGRR